VLSNPKLQKAALFLNLLGAILLFYSFQATSSDFKLITTSSKSVLPDSKQYALCVNDYALIVSDGKNGISLGHPGCPDWEDARPAAVVSIEHPWFEKAGFSLLILGFLLQCFPVPQAETVAHLRKQLKSAKLREDVKKSN
jgi:hypothetical protein